MMIVFCENTSCVHNDGQACKLSVITLSLEYGEMKEGQRTIHNACQNYRGKEDAD